MRILHTSDWHLGKKLFKLDRTEEHVLFLEWLLEIIKEKEIDLLLVAGDIFDTPTPPHQSLEIFYEFLHKISTGTKTQTYIIAGNHDSGLLLEAPSKILAPHRVKVWGKLSPRADDHWVNIRIGNETIDLCALPFFRSYELLPNGEGDALEVLRKYLKKESANPQILMLHHLAGDFEAAGSEQVISLSGVDSIPKEILSSFQYVALGHIHKPQKIAGNAYYSGSPIPMRFSETQQKSVRILEVKKNVINVDKLEIPVTRALHIVKTDEESWKNRIEALENQSPLTPMVEVQISLKQPTVGMIEEIKKRLELKGMELLSFIPSYSAMVKNNHRNEKLFELSPMEVFKEFYKFKYPDSSCLSEELEDDFKELIQKVQNASDQT